MRRQSSTASLLYHQLFPNPGPSDPSNFSLHLARHLIPEIRVETARFYGSLDSIEARYPGLNYCYRPHRMRLCTFPHHARLFAAIDRLGLTDSEVQDLVRWEGTIWARERFERDEGFKVRDTTGDGIRPWVDPRRAKRDSRIKVNTEVEVAVEEVPASAQGAVPRIMTTTNVEAAVDEECVDRDEIMTDDEDEDDARSDDVIEDTIQSIGNDLNRRLRAAVEARQQGQQVDMDPEFEAYLKDYLESGSIEGLMLASAGHYARQAYDRAQQQQRSSSVGHNSPTLALSQPAA